MNAKQLIEAATRLRERHGEWRYVEAGSLFGKDVIASCDHILSTVHPDDDEPVTRERLEADGWKYHELLHNREEYVHPNGMAIVCDNGEYRRYGTVLQTMRKVRLVAALGE